MLNALLSLVLALTVTGPTAQQPAPAAGSAGKVSVYRVKTCGCCSKWMDHLRSAGFDVTEHVVERSEDAPPRAKVPEALRSCHTAQIGGYIVEGHVPADVIKDLLQKKPAVVGIAVPGMPAGSPGMESPNPEAYNVIAFNAKGGTYVFASMDPTKKK